MRRPETREISMSKYTRACIGRSVTVRHLFGSRPFLDGITLEAVGDAILTAANPDLAIKTDAAYPAVVNHVVYFGDGVSRKTVLRGFKITGANGYVTTSEANPIEPSTLPNCIGICSSIRTAVGSKFSADRIRRSRRSKFTIILRALAAPACRSSIGAIPRKRFC